MYKYAMGEALGDGSFGSVSRALNRETGAVVAVKKIKRRYESWEQCLQLNEVRMLVKLHHPNIICLYEVVKESNQLHLVMEYMHENVLQLQQRSNLSLLQVRNIGFQTLQAVSYMHRQGYFHRDLKPQNLLYHHGVVKLADFGLVRGIRAQPPFTEYVSTRWYRAPQVLLHSTSYNSPMDVFAVGAILAQLLRGAPLFAGCSEKDQLDQVLRVMGTPTIEEWPDGHRLAAALGIPLPQHKGVPLQQMVPTASPSALQLLYGLLQVNPSRRITAAQALKYQYFVVKADQKGGNHLGSTFVRQEKRGDQGEEVRYRPGVVCNL